MMSLYKTLVRPHVEYCSSAWSSLYKKNKELIEHIQHRFTSPPPITWPANGSGSRGVQQTDRRTNGRRFWRLMSPTPSVAWVIITIGVDRDRGGQGLPDLIAKILRPWLHVLNKLALNKCQWLVTSVTSSVWHVLYMNITCRRCFTLTSSLSSCCLLVLLMVI